MNAVAVCKDRSLSPVRCFHERRNKMNDQTKAFAKAYDELNFNDDFMFGKTMEDPKLCRDVIECLLQRPVGELSPTQTQKEYKYTVDGKPIRLDVYNKDSFGTIYDTEMQNLNHKKVEDLQLPKRTRFYQSSIDIDCLDKTGLYKDLPDSNILFICTFDPFECGLAQYTFRPRCDEDTELVLKSGTEWHYYNCTYKGDKIPEGLRDLYEYIRTGRPDNELTERIHSAVIKGRKNKEWRSAYMKEMVLLMDAREEGRAEERKNTERERKKAERERLRAEKAEARIKELEAQLAR